MPVDFVSNSIILGTAAQINKNSMSIIHSSTKHLSSVSLKEFSKEIVDYFLLYPNEQTFRTPYNRFVSKRTSKVIILYLITIDFDIL